MTTAQDLDRSITIERLSGERNEIGEVITGWRPILTVRAKRRDVADGERFAAGGIGGFLTARFTVRSTQNTRAIRSSDEIVHEGRRWNLVGIKELDEGRHHFLELTANVSVD